MATDPANDKEPADPLAPSSSSADAFAGPLAAVTLITDSLPKTEALYSGLFGLERADPEAPTDPALARQLWGLPDDFDFQEVLLRRADQPAVPCLRVLVSAQAAEPVRPAYKTTLEGGLSVGFVMHDIGRVVEQGAAAGFPTSAGVVSMDMARPDGTPYQVHECHFLAPDDVYALGVERPPDLAQIGPIAAGDAVGGPAYTGQVMNHCDATLAFYTDVLGYEVRRRMTVGGPLVEKGLGLDPDTSFEFLQVFAPGSTTAYFIVLDFADGGQPNPAIAPPHRGVVMWTVPVADVAQVAAAAPASGASVLAGPLVGQSALFGERLSVSIRTANGFIIECVQMDAA